MRINKLCLSTQFVRRQTICTIFYVLSRAGGCDGQSIEQTDWHIDGRTLRKQYQYDGLNGGDSRHILRIDIDVTPNAFSVIQNIHVSLVLGPHPWPSAREGFVVAQLAATDDLINSPFVLLRAGSTDDGSLILMPSQREGSDAFLATIALAKEMRLLLLLSDDEEPLLQMPIPNDEQYLLAARSYFAAVGAPPRATKNAWNTRRAGQLLRWLITG